MNKVVLTGRICKDPEVKYSQSNIAMVGFVLAVNRNFKDQNGNYSADFIGCKAFGVSADYIGKYVHKGNMLCIEGRIQTGQYQNQLGTTVYTTDVIIERVENLTPRDAQNTNIANHNNISQNISQNGNYNKQSQQPTYQQPQYGSMPQSFDVGPVSDNDLPF